MLPPLKNAFQYIYDQLAKNKTANFDEEEKETKYCPNCKTEVAPTFHGLCPECDLEL
jgi:Zn finger protein HypA/HybF involved in hydrogenase expression